MENQSTQSHGRLAASIVLVGVIGASLVGAAFVGAGTVTSASSSSTALTSGPRAELATTTSNSSLGLKLALAVNSTTIPSQDVIEVTASLANTRQAANNLMASDHWPIQGMRAGSCDTGNNTNHLYFPIGLAFFRGSYGLDNLSQAGQPLFVWAEHSCIVRGVSVGKQYYALRSITSYSLLPGSYNGTYAGYYAVPGTPPPPVCAHGVCTYDQTPQSLVKGVFPTRMAVQETINAANGSGSYNSLHSAVRANYTLVAGDEWGQIVLLHFAVVPSDNLPKVGSFLSRGGDGGCAENNNPAPCVTSQFSHALIFNCAAQAATASGCTTQVPSSGPWSATSYTITAWFPYLNHPGEPAQANCMFYVRGYTSSPYGYCFKVNSTAFALSPRA
jgi:hypothetical protein